MTPALFRGLSAFPLTPLVDDVLDEQAFSGLIRRLAVSDVDSVTVLGSTGSYAYLSTQERARVVDLALEHAGEKPVFVGVGALRTSDVVANVGHAHAAGAHAVLLAPMTYQPLTDDEVFGLFEQVTSATDLPVIMYDNPGTTHFNFSLDLYARLAQLSGVASIKIPPVVGDPVHVEHKIGQIRDVLPARVTIGISGDAFAHAGLRAGCDAWYSALAGVLPELVCQMYREATQDPQGLGVTHSDDVQNLRELLVHYGSLRVVAAIAHVLGLVGPDCLPQPVQSLPPRVRGLVEQVVASGNLRK